MQDQNETYYSNIKATFRPATDHNCARIRLEYGSCEWRRTIEYDYAFRGTVDNVLSCLNEHGIEIICHTLTRNAYLFCVDQIKYKDEIKKLFNK